ncbi:MAG: acylneuraminate cytidylyltransferase [Thermoplasmatales archaeon]|nr:MAG: acylneuraminate cytidylyltransferase [Thermoplasmatales archaeon]
MKIVSIIPARGGSKGIPRKNIKMLGGKPLISYVINSSLASKYISETYVSTDDKEIAKISREFGAKIIKRPSNISTDNTSSEEVLLHFADNVDFAILILLQCTSPLTRSEDIDGALDLYFSSKFDSVLSVCKDSGGFLCGGFTWDENGKSFNFDYKERPRRQDMKKFYRENGAIYIVSKENLIKYKCRLCGKVGIYEMPKERSFEIDEPEDFEFLNKIFPLVHTQEFYYKNFSNLKLIIFDVDGVFTDGSVYLDKHGNELLRFSRLDGKGVELLLTAGYKIAIISTEASEAAKKRIEKLNITESHLGIKNKLDIYNKLKKKYKLSDSEICFCGDDISDLEVLKKVGFSCCPSNAQQSVKKVCHYVSAFKGGSGFIRDISNIVRRQT